MQREALRVAVRQLGEHGAHDAVAQRLARVFTVKLAINRVRRAGGGSSAGRGRLRRIERRGSWAGACVGADGAAGGLWQGGPDELAHLAAGAAGDLGEGAQAGAHAVGGAAAAGDEGGGATWAGEPRDAGRLGVAQGIQSGFGTSAQQPEAQVL